LTDNPEYRMIKDEINLFVIRRYPDQMCADKPFFRFPK